MNEIFPKGMEQALRDLMKSLNDAPSTYSVRVFRYQDHENYQAEVTVVNAVTHVTLGEP